jgi:hypothetical protein
MRDLIMMSPEDVELILGWIAEAEKEGLLESAEADRQRKRQSVRWTRGLLS